MRPLQLRKMIPVSFMVAPLRLDVTRAVGVVRCGPRFNIVSSGVNHAAHNGQALGDHKAGCCKWILSCEIYDAGDTLTGVFARHLFRVSLGQVDESLAWEFNALSTEDQRVYRPRSGSSHGESGACAGQ